MLVLLPRRHIRRRNIRMILQILLPGFVAKHHPESPLRIHIDGFLHIQFVVGKRMLDGLQRAFLEHAVMHLAVHEPVVGHPVYRAVFLIEPNQIALSAIQVHRTFVTWDCDKIFKTVTVERRGIALESPAPCPPQSRAAARPPHAIEPKASCKPETPRAEKHSAPKDAKRTRPKAETAAAHS